MTRGGVVALCVVLIGLVSPAGAQPTESVAISSFREGVDAQERGAWEVARRAYERAIRAKPDFAEAHANLGVVLARLGRHDAAVAAYERALSIAPELQAARINLGLAHFRAGEIRRAVDAFQAALARDPSSAQARQLLGLALVEVGREDEAIPHLEAVRTTEEEDPAVLFALGRAYAAAADPKADEIATRLATTPAGRPLWQHLRGLVLQRQGRHREALSVFEAARAAQPELPGAWLAAGISELALGEETAAREAFEQARAQAPRDAVPAFYLAWIAERAGRFAAARQLVEQALVVDPDLVEARALLGRVLLNQDAPAEATQHLARAATQEPKDASIRYLLAQAYQRTGDKAAAKREFDEARRLKAQEITRERPSQGDRHLP